MRAGAFLDALANAMGAKPKVVKRFIEALEKVLVKELKETGSAKIPSRGDEKENKDCTT